MQAISSVATQAVSYVGSSLVWGLPSLASWAFGKSSSQWGGASTLSLISLACVALAIRSKRMEVINEQVIVLPAPNPYGGYPMMGFPQLPNGTAGYLRAI